MKNRQEKVLEFIIHTLKENGGSMNVKALNTRITRKSDPFFDTSDLLLRLMQMGYANFEKGQYDVSLTEKGHAFFNFTDENYNKYLEEKKKKELDDLKFISMKKDIEIKALTTKKIKLTIRQKRWALALPIISFLAFLFKKEIYQFVISIIEKM